jgi:hypothetical protein
MRFEVTSEDHMVSITDDLQTEADERSTFATEQELHEIGGAWPMSADRVRHGLVLFTAANPAALPLTTTKRDPYGQPRSCGDGPGDQSSKPPAPPRHKPVSAEVNKVVEFWRSLAFGGPEVCSDVLADDDLETLHVAQDLDQFLLDRVRKGFSIILTGNAGDGKTHLLRRLEPELQRFNAVVQYDASAAMDHTKIAPILNEWRKARKTQWFMWHD